MLRVNTTLQLSYSGEVDQDQITFIVFDGSGNLRRTRVSDVYTFKSNYTIACNEINWCHWRSRLPAQSISYFYLETLDIIWVTTWLCGLCQDSNAEVWTVRKGWRGSQDSKPGGRQCVSITTPSCWGTDRWPCLLSAHCCSSTKIILTPRYVPMTGRQLTPAQCPVKEKNLNWIVKGKLHLDSE